jgi:hypothetical protein
LAVDEESGEWLLPDCDLNDPDRAWQMWTLLEALDWKFPPDVLERQDAALLHDLMEISSASTLVKRMLEEMKK